MGISIDIEDWYHIPPISGTPNSIYKNAEDFRMKWKSKYDCLSEPTLKTLDILDDLGISATIFIVADVIEHYPELVNEIRKRNRHEIGCHGLTHESILDPKTKSSLFDASSFKERTIRAKKMLEESFGKQVVGYRAPNAYIAGWMSDALEEIGFEYDSSVSVNSIYNKTDSSLSGVNTKPYFPEMGNLHASDNSRTIVEIPFCHYNLLGFKIPTNGGPIMRFLGPRIIIRGLRQSLTKGDSIFYFHPIDIYRKEFPYPVSTQKLFWLIKGETVQKHIERILTNFINEGVELVPLKTISDNMRRIGH